MTAEAETKDRQWNRSAKTEERALRKHGWGKHSNDQTRHEALKASVKEDGYATTRWRIQYLKNISQDPTTRKVASQDGQWMEANKQDLKALAGRKPTTKTEWKDRYRVHLQKRKEGKIFHKSVIQSGRTETHARALAQIQHEGFTATQATKLHPKPRRQVRRHIRK